MRELALLAAAELWYEARGWLPEIRTLRARQRTLYREFIKRDDLCFDVGAHIGDRTRAFLDLGARVVAIDPQPSAVTRLNFAFGRNQRVAIVSAGLGANDGEADLAICDAAPTISTLSTEFRTHGRFAAQYEWSRTVRVPITTLDGLIARFGVPAFCKIDVEGYEREVIRGLSQAIPALSFEFGWDTLPTVAACLEHLADLGTAWTNYSLGETMVWAQAEWLRPEDLLKRLSILCRDAKLGGDVYVRLHAASSTLSRETS